MNNDMLLLERHFDCEYYRNAYPDIENAGVDPLEHFCVAGWREGRNPTVDFDTDFYLRQNADVASAGINPYAHYIVAGRDEGRLGKQPLHEKRLRIQHAYWSINYRSRGYEPEIPAGGLLSPSRLTDLLREHFVDGPILLSISHDDYRTNLGGVQRLLLVEEALCKEDARNYLHLSPSCHRLGLAEHASDIPVVLSVRLNGEQFGFCTPATFVEGVRSSRPLGQHADAVVHHLMGHDPAEIAWIIAQIQCQIVVAWTHDFFTLCPSINLMRNDVAFCGAPDPESMACTMCSHGQSRRAFVTKLEGFFQEFDPVIMSPSAAALRIWRDHSAFKHRLALPRPLARLSLHDSRLPYETSEGGKPIKVAFLGHRTYLKGWTVYEKLALALRNDERFEFHHLGLAYGIATSGHIIHTPVNIAEQGEDAMLEAVVAANIDVVIIWSQCPETFCYAAHEALAGGAFLLAPDGPGNVPSLIRELTPAQGALVEGEEQLLSLFASGKLIKLLKLTPRRRGLILAQNDTVSWLREHEIAERGLISSNDPRDS